MLTRRTILLSLVAGSALLAQTAPAPQPAASAAPTDALAADWARVTAPPPVTSMGMPEEGDAKRIDGRWWTKDHREIVRTESGLYRVAANDPNYRLYHLAPFDAGKANQLHLYITADQAMSVLGTPNDVRVVRDGASEQLRYLSADGTATQVLILNGLVVDVRLEAAKSRGGPIRRPPAIEQELNGKDPLLALRIRLNPALATAAPGSGPGEPSAPAPPPVPILPYIPPPPETNLRTIPAQLLGNVTEGATRADVVSRLGDPNSDMIINGSEDGPHETLHYKLDTGVKVAIRLVDQKVVEISTP